MEGTRIRIVFPTPLGCSRKTLLEILEGPRYDSLHEACDIHDEEKVKELFEKKTKKLVKYLNHTTYLSYFLEYVLQTRQVPINHWKFLRALIKYGVGMELFQFLDKEKWMSMEHPTKRLSVLYYAVRADNLDVVRFVLQERESGRDIYRGAQPAILVALSNEKYRRTALAMIDSTQFDPYYPTDRYVQAITKNSYYLTVIRMIEKLVPFTREHILVLDDLGFTRKASLLYLNKYFLHRISAIRNGYDPEVTVPRSLIFQQIRDTESQSEVLRLIKGRSYDLHGTDAYGLYLMSYVPKERGLWLGKILPKYGYDPMQCGYGAVFFFDAVSRGATTKEVKKFLRMGVDVNARQPGTQYTALHYAVRFRNIELAFLLLEYGASPHYVSLSGETALLHAFLYQEKKQRTFLNNKRKALLANNLVAALRARGAKYYVGGHPWGRASAEYEQARQRDLKGATLAQLIYYTHYELFENWSFWDTERMETRMRKEWLSMPKTLMPMRWILHGSTLIWFDRRNLNRGAFIFDAEGRAPCPPDEHGDCYLTKRIEGDWLYLERHVVDRSSGESVVSRTICRRHKNT